MDVATAARRNTKTWQNTNMLWSEMLNKLSVTHRTHETHKEYMAFPKDQQDSVKDVGGFVGGYLTNGRRKPGAVLHRSIITLDIDYGRPHIWEDFTMLNSYAAALHSTHKHTPVTPRVRILIPLSREIAADEYEAIGRRIAGDLGIDMFDSTGFQPWRLMYWPSTSKDAEYLFEYQDGPLLDPDAVLGTYVNWKDVSAWPTPARDEKRVNSEIKKQGDPLDKPGVIGAFCRTYGIAAAVEKFLPTDYEACDTEDRYTYTGGSTSAGAVSYQDKYMYSHHATDPTSGKLCNAFDLVRIHLFSSDDENVKPDTPINKMPSYLRMCELATDDPEVRLSLGTERMQRLEEDFPEMDWPDEEVNLDWVKKLKLDKSGTVLSTSENVKIILENDVLLKNKFAYDAFENREIAIGNLPWRKIEGRDYLVPIDGAGLRHHLEKVYKISAPNKIADALMLIIHANTIHPVRDYLNNVKWDGIERVDTLLIDYLGAEDTEYVRTITRKSLISAVARIFQPGCKVDASLSLVGPEGVGKSTLLERLGGKWYSNSLSTVVGKEAYEQLQGVWIVEIPELSAFGKGDVEAQKAFMDKGADRFRVPYSERAETFYRQCIFVPTTNHYDFLKSDTGSRRFLPATTGKKGESAKSVFDITEYDIKQIWAETVKFYESGEQWHLNAELDAIAKEVQQEHTLTDIRSGVIENYLDCSVPEDWENMDLYERRSWLNDPLSKSGVRLRGQICVAEIFCECFGGRPADMTNANTKHIHSFIRNLKGWRQAKSKRIFNIYGKQTAYYRVENHLEKRYI